MINLITLDYKTVYENKKLLILVRTHQKKFIEPANWVLKLQFYFQIKFENAERYHTAKLQLVKSL